MKAKPLILSILMIVGLVAILFGLISILCNGEISREYYRDYTEAIESGRLYERGFSQILPLSAEDIRLQFDLDSNRFFMTFTYDPHDLASMLKQFKKLDFIPHELPPGPSWWINSEFKDGRMIVDDCGAEIRYGSIKNITFSVTGALLSEDEGFLIVCENQGRAFYVEPQF
jgi:hypothetical protein